MGVSGKSLVVSAPFNRATAAGSSVGVPNPVAIAGTAHATRHNPIDAPVTVIKAEGVGVK